MTRDQSEDRPHGSVVYGQETPYGMLYGVLRPDGTDSRALYPSAGYARDVADASDEIANQRRLQAAARAAAEVDADSDFNWIRSST